MLMELPANDAGVVGTRAARSALSNIRPRCEGFSRLEAVSNAEGFTAAPPHERSTLHASVHSARSRRSQAREGNFSQLRYASSMTWTYWLERPGCAQSRLSTDGLCAAPVGPGNHVLGPSLTRTLHLRRGVIVGILEMVVGAKEEQRTGHWGKEDSGRVLGGAADGSGVTL